MVDLLDPVGSPPAYAHPNTCMQRALPPEMRAAIVVAIPTYVEARSVPARAAWALLHLLGAAPGPFLLKGSQKRFQTALFRRNKKNPPAHDSKLRIAELRL